jgi:hypothetical protein
MDTRLVKREATKFVFGLGVQRLGEVGQEEHRQHPVTQFVVGGVEELCRLANPVNQTNSILLRFPMLNLHIQQ